MWSYILALGKWLTLYHQSHKNERTQSSTVTKGYASPHPILISRCSQTYIFSVLLPHCQLPSIFGEYELEPSSEDDLPFFFFFTTPQSTSTCTSVIFTVELLTTTTKKRSNKKFKAYFVLSQIVGTSNLLSKQEGSYIFRPCENGQTLFLPVKKKSEPTF